MDRCDANLCGALAFAIEWRQRHAAHHGGIGLHRFMIERNNFLRYGFWK